MSSSSESCGLLEVNFSLKGIKPANVVPNHKDNPAVFMGVAESSSEIDDGVDNGDKVSADMMIDDV
jgi:hypothetical protein